MFGIDAFFILKTVLCILAGLLEGSNTRYSILPLLNMVVRSHRRSIAPLLPSLQTCAPPIIFKNARCRPCTYHQIKRHTIQWNGENSGTHLKCVPFLLAEDFWNIYSTFSSTTNCRIYIDTVIHLPFSNMHADRTSTQGMCSRTLCTSLLLTVLSRFFTSRLLSLEFSHVM